MATIYERPPRSTPYVMVVGGRPINDYLGGWSANSVIVDNHSSQHVFLRDVGIYCPPRTVGNVVPLPALGRVHAEFGVPPGLDDGPAVAGQTAGLTFYAEALTPNPGVPDGQVAVTIPRRKLYPDGVVVPSVASTPSFTVASGGLSGAKVFTLPPGTVSLRVMVTAGGLVFAYSLLALGSQTAEQYYGDPAAPGSSVVVPTPTLPFTIPIENDWDTQIELHVEQPTQNVNVFVSALFAPEQPGQAGAAQSVTQVTPQAWQTPNAGNGGGTGLIAAAGNLTLVPAPGGVLNTYLHVLMFNIVGAAGSFCDLQNSSGTALGWRIDTSQSTPGPVAFPFFGRRIGPLGVQLHNSSANPTGAINFGAQYNQS